MPSLVPPPDVPPPPTPKSGYLLKRSGGKASLSLGDLLNKADKRYFTLVAGELSWSRDPDETFHGSVTFGTIFVSDCACRQDGKTFVLHAPGRVLTMHAQTEAEASDWVGAILGHGAEAGGSAAVRAPSETEAAVCAAVRADLGSAVTWAEHEGELRSVFEALAGEEAAATFTHAGAAWKSVGFQREDPLTDFRGGGVAALQWLAWFAGQRREHARASLARHEALRAESSCERGMPWAAATINVVLTVANVLRIARHAPAGQSPELAPSRWYGLLGSRESFSLLVLTAFELVERDFAREGSFYLQFNASLRRMEKELGAALASEAAAGSHAELRAALGLPGTRAGSEPASEV